MSTSTWRPVTIGPVEKMSKSKNNGVNIKVNKDEYAPQQISAIVLQNLKKTAEEYLGTKQRFCLVFSEQALKREEKTFVKSLQKGMPLDKRFIQRHAFPVPGAALTSPRRGLRRASAPGAAPLGNLGNYCLQGLEPYFFATCEGRRWRARRLATQRSQNMRECMEKCKNLENKGK